MLGEGSARWEKKTSFTSCIVFELYSYSKKLIASFFFRELHYVCAWVTAVWGKDFTKRFQHFRFKHTLVLPTDKG